MEASWWERLTRGKPGLVLMGGAMLRKSLIQFSVDGWSCVPSLLFDLRPSYGGGKEDNGDPLQKLSDFLHLASWCVIKNVYWGSRTSPPSWTDLLLINPFHVLRLPHSFKVCALTLPSCFIPCPPPTEILLPYSYWKQRGDIHLMQLLQGWVGVLTLPVTE